MWVHRFAGASIWLITLILGIMAVKRAGWEVVNSWHTVIGFIILVVVTLITVGGVFSRSMMRRLKWKTHVALKIKTGHRIFGLLLITLS